MRQGRCHPTTGGTKTPEREAYEKSREFKDGPCASERASRGRISVLFRGRGMKCCLAEGRERFELWVAAAVLGNNLMKIATCCMQRSSSRERKSLSRIVSIFLCAAERTPLCFVATKRAFQSEPAAFATKCAPMTSE